MKKVWQDYRLFAYKQPIITWGVIAIMQAIDKNTKTHQKALCC
jgi:hypothetical protein